jgi:hypothetical protein
MRPHARQHGKSPHRSLARAAVLATIIAASIMASRMIVSNARQDGISLAAKRGIFADQRGADPLPCPLRAVCAG